MIRPEYLAVEGLISGVIMKGRPMSKEQIVYLKKFCCIGLWTVRGLRFIPGFQHFIVYTPTGRNFISANFPIVQLRIRMKILANSTIWTNFSLVPQRWEIGDSLS